MNELMKAAGERDALSAFNLAHGTPRPPPSWAQEWLEGTRKSGTKHLTIPSMREKKAFLGSLLLGGGLHLGANLGQKILRKTNLGKRIEQSQFASGLRHGFEGKQLHPATDKVMRFGLGPEALAHYEAGQAAAKELVAIAPENRAAALKRMGGMLGETEHLSKAPMIRSAPGGIERFLKGEKGFMDKHLTAVPQGQQVPLHERLVAPALGAATLFAAPHAAIQLGVNKGRDFLAKKFGPAWTAKELAAGARGQTISPLRRAATDYVISPAANDPRDIGLAAHKEYQGAQQGINKYLIDRGHKPVNLPGPDAIVDYAEGVGERLKKRPTPTQAPTAAPANRGGLGTALMLGGGLYTLRNRLQDDPATQ